MLGKHILARIRVPPGAVIHLKKCDTKWVHTQELKEKGLEVLKAEAKKTLKENIENLAEAQELLYASDTVALLIVLQGMDAAGKDGTIKHVMSGLNPQGCVVHSFKQPSPEELNHTFLWRYGRVVPERGRICIFNRSYYEEVIVVRVHPELLNKQHPHSKKRSGVLWKERYEDINSFERHLVRNGTVILKFFLHISKKEQRERLLARLENPRKLWKFSLSDITERDHWTEYQKAYEHAFAATSTSWVPWYIVPADYKWAARALVADVITATIHSLKLRYPVLDDDMKRQIELARKKLEKR